MNKDNLFILISCLLTLGLGLAVLAWRAPGLLEREIPIDLQMVQVDEKVPPFFDGVFRDLGGDEEAMIIRDPYLMRATPFFPDRVRTGPHDLLGFRNRSVPNMADVVVIGDSQTYGINATLETSWPGQLSTLLASKGAVVYNVSVGGWGPAEYFRIFDKVLSLRPRLVVVAIYMGNDPLNAFVRVRGHEHFKDLAPEEDLQLVEVPRVLWPVPKSHWWTVRFADGSETSFTPSLRHNSHADTPAARLGNEITAKVVRLLAAKAEQAGVEIFFTLVPTKELGMSRKLAGEEIEARQDYATLVRDEARNLRALEGEIRQLPGSPYVDVLGPLQAAAEESSNIYPADSDGHLLEAGYGVIARAVAGTIAPRLPDAPEGLVQVQVQKSGGRSQRQFVWVEDGQVWRFSSPQVVKENGLSLRQAKKVEARQLLNLPHRGWIDGPDLSRFQP